MNNGKIKIRGGKNKLKERREVMRSKPKIIAFVVMVTVVVTLLVISGTPRVTAPTPIPKVQKWTLTGQAFCGKANRLYELGEDFAYMIEKYTDGRVKINFHSAGEIVPAAEVYDAAGKGVIDFGQGCPCLARSKCPALQMFCDVPGGQSPIEEVVWLYHGGGLKILQDLFEKHYHCHPLPMIAITTEIWIYSNKKIKTLDDLKGLKMRAAGMRAEVLKEMGASVVILPGGEIVPAMEKGVIDAMEYSSLNCTYPLGFCDVVKYIYFHPKKATSPINLWAVNLDVWNSFPKDIKEAIERASRDAFLRSLTWGMEQDFLTLKKAVEEKGVEVLYLPEDVARAVDEAAAEHYYKLAETDPEMKLILDSWAKFKAEYNDYAPYMDEWTKTGDHLGLVKGPS
ncbi:MAG: hypothetical protein DRG36_06305 [Deltaproteobacteria bacterium]|nr:MAG: hypothetical protein DRG36_06305 [Deltaproteobacteria bacterium]